MAFEPRSRATPTSSRPAFYGPFHNRTEALIRIKMMLHSLNLPAGLEPKELGIIWVGPGGVDILLAPAMVKEGDQTLGTSIVVEDHGSVAPPAETHEGGLTWRSIPETIARMEGWLGRGSTRSAGSSMRLTRVWTRG